MITSPEKLKIGGGGKNGAGTGLFKREGGAGGLALFLFSFFKVYHFKI